MGTRKKPTSLELLQGCPGKRPINDKEPKPDPDMPVMPSYVTGIGKEQWEVIAPQLHEMGVLTSLDGSALAMYCCEFSKWRQAIEQIEKYGLVIKTKDGKIQKSPFVKISEDSLNNMIKIMREYGMTPSSRAGLKVEKKPEVSEMDKLLNAK